MQGESPPNHIAIKVGEALGGLKQKLPNKHYDIITKAPPYTNSVQQAKYVTTFLKFTMCQCKTNNF